MAAELEEFSRQVACTYEEESYSVRDNGAVYRHEQKGRRSRQADGVWTFGKPNIRNGYLEIASVRVHRIVATAFHGEPPTRQHVVDHIDTNRHNNRPENLRWVTKLENVLLNPITAKRIALLYGSVEAFLDNPRMQPLHSQLEKNLDWMRNVSKEEAKQSYGRLLEWAMSDRPHNGGALGEWIFNRGQSQPKPSVEKFLPTDLVESLTPMAMQRRWKVPTEFPACPSTNVSEPLKTYVSALNPETIFATNKVNKSKVIKAALASDQASAWVMCEFIDETVKPFALAKITLEEGRFVHTSEGTFFGLDGAEKYFALGQGLEWSGGEVFDDFC